MRGPAWTFCGHNSWVLCVSIFPGCITVVRNLGAFGQESVTPWWDTVTSPSASPLKFLVSWHTCSETQCGNGMWTVAKPDLCIILLMLFTSTTIPTLFHGRFVAAIQNSELGMIPWLWILFNPECSTSTLLTKLSQLVFLHLVSYSSLYLLKTSPTVVHSKCQSPHPLLLDLLW